MAEAPSFAIPGDGARAEVPRIRRVLGRSLASWPKRERTDRFRVERGEADLVGPVMEVRAA